MYYANKLGFYSKTNENPENNYYKYMQHKCIILTSFRFRVEFSSLAINTVTLLYNFHHTHLQKTFIF